MRLSLRIAVLLVVVATISLACLPREIDTSIKVDSGIPPRFTLSGSGVIAHLIAYEIDPRRDLLPPEEREPLLSQPIWRIEAEPVQLEIDALPPIEYGQVPLGFIQTIPEGRAVPPKLVEGKIYRAIADVLGAAGGTVKFTISNGRTTVLSEP